MTGQGVDQILLFLVGMIALAYPLVLWMAP
jgi:hypothetical protein